MQALKGHFHFELGKYLGWYVLPSTVSVVLFAMLAIFMQTLVPQKSVGWMLMLLFVVAQITLDRLGFEHNLYQYAGNPGTPLSDMNGQGDFARHAWWFRAYWTCRRRDAGGARVRRCGVAASARRCGFALARLPSRLRGAAGALLAAAAVRDGRARRAGSSTTPTC